MSAAALSRLAQECYDRALAERRTTRQIAVEIVASTDAKLRDEMAVEFLVSIVAREQRAAALKVEREAEQPSAAHENKGGSPWGRIPRKGTRARIDWEMNTPEGQAFAQSEAKAQSRYDQMLHGVIKRSLDRYAEDLRIKWTAELLDSTFALADGTLVKWGDATIEHHIERRQIFLNNAHANMEGAARHEVALRELQETGAPCLREMVGMAA